MDTIVIPGHAAQEEAAQEELDFWEHMFWSPTSQDASTAGQIDQSTEVALKSAKAGKEHKSAD